MILGELAKQLGARVEGDANLNITGVAGLDEATATEVSFLSNRKYFSKLKATAAAAVIE